MLAMLLLLARSGNAERGERFDGVAFGMSCRSVPHWRNDVLAESTVNAFVEPADHASPLPKCCPAG